MPTVSIITPAYNAERTILETIESVQKQTYSDFELIIIDDGSKDRTVELVQSIKDERLKVFSYENGGVCVARNRGLPHATGEFIAFIDADDLWTPDKLELQLAALREHPEAGVAYSWTYFMYEQEGSVVPGKPVSFEGNVYPKLLVENFLAHGSNPLIRRKAIESVGEFDSTFPHCADWDFYRRLALCWPFVVVRKHQIYYRQSSSSMTSKVEGIERQMLAMFEKAFQTAPSEYQYLKNQSLAWLYEYCTQQYLQYSTDLHGINQAGQKLWKAIRLHPPILLDDYAQSLMRWFFKKWIQVKLSLGKF
ncbi:glycosyltransferase [Microcoleus sp. FACHB-SPT15]|uniref:glycosyltransferase family 2 protein n=1 Tax=Microcoleus sp. FACHB-SPT15 TaxID=2692830 RepID=UPI00177D4068|nr:glycosyltransferase [Microcoleus sp. FACHB-SPT15]MBD1809591.1 glycosyltransferase [Microcoleus sp. FACHB-SPT15]